MKIFVMLKHANPVQKAETDMTLEDLCPEEELEGTRGVQLIIAKNNYCI